MAKSLLRQKARRLRKDGFGIKTIATKLHVSSSTVSLWCRDIILTPEQIKELERRSHDPYYGRRLEHVKKQQRARQLKIKELLKRGIADVKGMTERELFFAGISLYWAEGFKKDNQIGLSNSDPSLIKFFILWLRRCCDVEKDRLKFRLGINEYHQNRAHEIQLYWMKELDVTKDQFQKSFFQKVRWKKTYDHPEDYHGVLRIRVTKSTNLLREVRGWIEGLKKYG